MRSEQGLHGHDWWRLTIRLRTLQAPIGEAGGADTDWEPVRETDLRVTGPILPEIRSRATRQESHEMSIWVYPFTRHAARREYAVRLVTVNFVWRGFAVWVGGFRGGCRAISRRRLRGCRLRGLRGC